GNNVPNNLRDPNSSIGKQFRGALQVILEDELAANKGVPLKDERIREIVGQLLSGDPNTGWGSWFQSPRYMGMSDPSAKTLNDMRQAAPWKSDIELQADFTKLKWKTYSDEYQKLKTQGEKPQVTIPKPQGPSVPASR